MKPAALERGGVGWAEGGGEKCGGEGEGVGVGGWERRWGKRGWEKQGGGREGGGGGGGDGGGGVGGGGGGGGRRGGGRGRGGGGLYDPSPPKVIGAIDKKSGGHPSHLSNRHIWGKGAMSAPGVYDPAA